jgi:hypothetical protein
MYITSHHVDYMKKINPKWNKKLTSVLFRNDYIYMAHYIVLTLW